MPTNITKTIHPSFLTALLALALSPCSALAQITFTATGYPTGDGASSVITGDFNRDGLPDFATVASTNGNITIFTNDGHGAFNTAATYTVPGASAVRTADVDRDGKLDLVISTNTGAQVLLGNGDGTFRFGQLLHVPFAPLGAFDLGDVKEDGYPDLVSKQCDFNTFTCRIYYYQNNRGTFAPGVSIASAGTPNSGSNLQLADLNADGHLDAVFTTDHYLETRFGNGAGAFTATYNVPLDGGFNFIVSKFNRASRAPDVVVDSNGPGPCDPFCQRYINVYSNNGRGVLTRTQRFLAYTGAFTAGDIDGDGTLDLISLFGSTDFNTLDYYPGHGDGTLASSPINIAVPFTGSSPLVRDLTLNGRHDLLYVEAVGGDATVLLNNNAPVICAPPSASAVHARICSLASDQTITGSGNAPAGILRLELWIDGAKQYETRNDQLRYQAHLHPGTHRFTIIAVDPSNAIAKQSANLVVH